MKNIINRILKDVKIKVKKGCWIGKVKNIITPNTVGTFTKYNITYEISFGTFLTSELVGVSHYGIDGIITGRVFYSDEMNEFIEYLRGLK